MAMFKKMIRDTNINYENGYLRDTVLGPKVGRY